MNINNNNVPEEEMSFNFGLDDILKSATESLVDPVTTEDNLNLLDDVISTVGDNIVKQPETKVEPVPTTQSTTTQADSKYNDDVYGTALNLMKEVGLFEVPDDIDVTDEEVWNGVIQDNREKYKQSIIDELRQNADPKVAELFDYAWNGGSWFGAEQMIETIQNEIDITNLNPSDNDHARYLIESYLAEGLDPQNPVHARRLANIDNEVNDYFERLEAEEMANEAKVYFLDKIELQKHNLAEQQKQHLHQQELDRRAEQQKQQQWATSFQDTLNKRNWSDSKKKEIIEQFSTVELDNGQSTEMWRYKFDSIWQDPEATQVLMDFLSDYDPYTHKFKRNGVPSTKQVTSTIQNIINAKNQNKSKSQHLDQRKASTEVKTIDPRNM